MAPRILTIHQMVENILTQYPGTRDNDRELIQTLYGKYYGVGYYKPFGAVIRDTNLPSFESIRRCRQKLQETNMALRGSKASEEVRLSKQEEYLEYAREGAQA